MATKLVNRVRILAPNHLILYLDTLLLRLGALVLRSGYERHLPANVRLIQLAAMALLCQFDCTNGSHFSWLSRESFRYVITTTTTTSHLGGPYVRRSYPYR